MDYSVREAKANFAHATNAAANGERVIITKHGKPFVEIVPISEPPAEKEDLWTRLDRAQAAMNLDLDDYAWPDSFNDPAFTRKVLGLEE